MSRLLQRLSGIGFPLQVLTTVSPFSAIWESFPFITVRSPTVLHGVFPLSLDDSTLFLASTPCDAALFGDNELDISSEASPARWSSLAHACLRDGLATLRRALLARLRSPPLRVRCDCPYDRLPQLLLLLLVQLRHREPLDAALARLAASWPSFRLAPPGGDIAPWVDTTTLALPLHRSSRPRQK